MMVGRVLKKLQNEAGEFDVRKVDILRHPGTALREGITMIPTLQLGERRLSGFFLSEDRIRDFLRQNQQ